MNRAVPILQHGSRGEHEVRRFERVPARHAAPHERTGSRPPAVSTPTTLPRMSPGAQRSRVASSIVIPSCCALSQPARRACATATVPDVR